MSIIGNLLDGVNKMHEIKLFTNLVLSYIILYVFLFVIVIIYLIIKEKNHLH